MPVSTQTWKIGDCIELMQELDDEYVDMIITSPPYWGLRDYGVDGQIGLEPTLEEYHARLLDVTAECMRVLKPSGVMFWNHGDSYGGSWQNYGAREGGQRDKFTDSFERHGNPTDTYPPSARMPAKSMMLQNERLILRMIDEQGWILRNRIIWHKPNGMPSSVTDRFSNKYEPVYMLTKNSRYWFDLAAVRVPHTAADRKRGNGGKNAFPGDVNSTTPHPLGKNPGDVVEMTQAEWMNYCHDVWDTFADERGDIMKIPTHPFKGSHFATFPPSLIEPLIKAACPAEICPICGMARERIVEPTGNMITMGGYGSKTADHIGASPTSSLRTKQVVEKHTVGWTSCNCDAGWVAGTVLDPFCGSGTVLEVCRKLNRNAIGFELNPEYEQLIRKRCMADIPPLTTYFENGGSD